MVFHKVKLSKRCRIFGLVNEARKAGSLVSLTMALVCMILALSHPFALCEMANNKGPGAIRGLLAFSAKERLSGQPVLRVG
jgi:hypothetical protein